VKKVTGAGRAGRARGRGARLRVLTLAAMMVLSACSGGTRSPGADRLTGCGPVTYADVRGERPTYGPQGLTRFANDHAMCAGRWLPGANDWLVPQGMAVSDGVAYVASYDGTQLAGNRLCTIKSVSLRTGELIQAGTPVRGRVGPRQPTECRHGGGVLVDEHGVWLAETQRLWLLDADTLAVRRAWALEEPVRGSFAVWGKDHELGLGRFRAADPARLWWFDVEALVSSTAYEIGADDALRAVPIPPMSQGAVWAELGGIGPGLWLATSNTSCGVLVGPDGRSRAFVPGAEAMALAEPDRLWVVSESGTRLYQEKGRPMTPLLARFHTADLAEWAEPTCSV